MIVDDAIVRPDSIGACVYRFQIPAGSTTVWLTSRSTVPAEVVAGSRDTRRLGVPLDRLALHNADVFIEVRHSHPALSEGFHEAEESLRWTDGLGRLPEAWLRAFGSACTLELHLAPSELGYRLDPPSRVAGAAWRPRPHRQTHRRVA